MHQNVKNVNNISRITAWLRSILFIFDILVPIDDKIILLNIVTLLRPIHQCYERSPKFINLHNAWLRPVVII